MINFYEKYKLDNSIVKSKEMKLLFKKITKLFAGGEVEWDLKEAERVINFIEKHCLKTLNEENIRLELWKKAFICLLYGIVVKDRNSRYFNEAFLVMNDKYDWKDLGSFLAFYHFLHIRNLDVIIASTSLKKTEEFFKVCSKIAWENNDIRKLVTINSKEIVYKKGTGRDESLIRISSGGESGSGRNLSFALLGGIDSEPKEKMKYNLYGLNNFILLHYTTIDFKPKKLYKELLSLSKGILEGKIDSMIHFLPFIEKKEVI